MSQEDWSNEERKQKRQTILVVDDTKMMRNVLRHALEHGGYSVVEAENGTDALLKLKQHQVDLVITDILMPDMDGLKLVEEIRSRASSANVPIIMCTAKGDRDTVLQSAQLHIQGYIVKPVNERVLLGKVRAILGDARTVQDESWADNAAEERWGNSNG